MAKKKVHLYEAVKLGKAIFDFTKCGKQMKVSTLVVDEVSQGVTCVNCLK